MSAGLLFAGAATLAVGFYVPLRRSHGMLKSEYAAVHQSEAGLREKLAATRAELLSTQTQRDHLASLQAQTEAERRRPATLATRFAEGVPAPLETAFEKAWLQVSPYQEGLAVAWSSPLLVQRSKSGLTARGQQLLCPLVARAQELHFPLIAIHTFAPANVAGVANSLEDAGRLGVETADRIVKVCPVSADRISVVSSIAYTSAPLLQLEFTAPAPTP